jgi:hypothetical protein
VGWAGASGLPTPNPSRRGGEHEHMNELTNFANPVAKAETFDQIKIGIASPEQIRSWSYRRDQEARDHQLPHVQARA